MDCDQDVKPVLGRSAYLTMAYGAMLLIPAFIGVGLSTIAQRGGITAGNAFIAPFCGPWSALLPPNAHPVSTWDPVTLALTRAWTVAFLGVLIGSYASKRQWLRTTTTLFSVSFLLMWVLLGLARVGSQLF